MTLIIDKITVDENNLKVDYGLIPLKKKINTRIL